MVEGHGTGRGRATEADAPFGEARRSMHTPLAQALLHVAQLLARLLDGPPGVVQLEGGHTLECDQIRRAVREPPLIWSNAQGPLQLNRPLRCLRNRSFAQRLRAAGRGEGGPHGVAKGKAAGEDNAAERQLLGRGHTRVRLASALDALHERLNRRARLLHRDDGKRFQQLRAHLCEACCELLLLAHVAHVQLEKHLGEAVELAVLKSPESGLEVVVPVRRGLQSKSVSIPNTQEFGAHAHHHGRARRVRLRPHVLRLFASAVAPAAALKEVAVRELRALRGVATCVELRYGRHKAPPALLREQGRPQVAHCGGGWKKGGGWARVSENLGQRLRPSALLSMTPTCTVRNPSKPASDAR